MSGNIEIEFGKSLSGDIIHINDAHKHYNYRCIECDKELVVVKGNILAHHFRHKVNDFYKSCGGGTGESELHKISKLIISKNIKKIIFVQECYNQNKNNNSCEDFIIDDLLYANVEFPVKTEYNKKYVIDVMATDKNGKKTCIEVLHGHETGEEKVNDLRKMDMKVIEIKTDEILYKFKNKKEDDYMIMNITPFYFDPPYKCDKCMKIKENERKLELERIEMRNKQLQLEQEIELKRKMKIKEEQEIQKVKAGIFKKCEFCKDGYMEKRYDYCIDCLVDMKRNIAKLKNCLYIVYIPGDFHELERRKTKKFTDKINGIESIRKIVNEMDELQNENNKLFDSIKKGTKRLENFQPSEFEFLENDISLDITYENRHIAQKHKCYWDKNFRKWFSPKTGIRDDLFHYLNKHDMEVWERYKTMVYNLRSLL